MSLSRCFKAVFSLKTRRLALLGLSALTTSQAFGGGRWDQVFIDDQDDSAIWLQGPSCEALLPHLEAVLAWKKHLGEMLPATRPNCECQKKGCRMELSDSLPVMAKKVVGKASVNSGPNCWNTALVGSGILPHLRGTSGSELTYWLDSSPLCHKRVATEELQPGDILAIRSDQGRTEVHAFIYASDRLTFSKHDSDAASYYELIPMKKVLGQYPPSKGCDSFKAGHECKKRVDAYSCLTLDQFLKEHATSEKAKQLKKDIEAVECNLQQALFSQLKDNGLESTILGTLGPLSTLLTAELTEKNLPECSVGDAVLLQGLRYRIESIQSEFRELGKEYTGRIFRK
ncbi:MAG: hypothetical protein H7222_03060 [Methylotenera sp.]|nr:hypothetical protein [Oligoflexia bacterium]